MHPLLAGIQVRSQINRAEREFTFDAAISFAGEDRAYASELAGLLVGRGIKVFYDDFQKSSLWGKNLYDHLSDVYENQARFCILLLSEQYARKRWTKLERQAAQARSFTGDTEYILPVRLDNSQIPGIFSTVSYLDWNSEGCAGVAARFLEKLRSVKGIQ